MKLLLLLLITLSVTTSFARTGGVLNGGGGKAVVCRGADGAIKSAEMLDIFEGRSIYNLTYNKIDTDLENAIYDLGEKIEHLTSDARDGIFVTRHSLIETYRYFKFLPEGVVINPVDDSLHDITLKGCQVEQLAKFSETRLILVNSEIWNSLDRLSQLALILHEDLYQDYRVYFDAENSKHARKVLAYLMSEDELTPNYKNIPIDGELVKCSTKNSSDKAYVWKNCTQNNQCETVFEFVKIAKKNVYTRTFYNSGLVFENDDTIYDYLVGEIKLKPGEKRGISGHVRTKIDDSEASKVRMSYKSAGAKFGNYIDLLIAVDSFESRSRIGSEEEMVQFNCVYEKKTPHGYNFRPIKTNWHD